jgi:hypothetical protein
VIIGPATGMGEFGDARLLINYSAPCLSVCGALKDAVVQSFGLLAVLRPITIVVRSPLGLLIEFCTLFLIQSLRGCCRIKQEFIGMDRYGGTKSLMC